MKKYFAKFYWLFIVLSIVIIDQITKITVRNSVLTSHEIIVFPGFFSLTYVKNEGIAFGAFAKYGMISKIFIIVFTFLLIIFTSYLLLSSKIKHPFGVISLSMIIGGGIGNLIDRVFIRFVTDFFAFTIFGRDFAVFNVADIFVTIGTFLFIVYFLFFEHFEKSHNGTGDFQNGDS